MKKLFVLLFVLQGLNMTAQEMLVDKIIGVVGNQAILLSDIEGQHALLEKQQGVLPEDARCYILDQLLVQNMLVVRGKLDSLIIDESQVDAQLAARIGQIMQYMGGDESQFIEYYGKTPDEVKEDFREDLTNQLLAQQMQQMVLNSVKVTPSEVVDFYNQIPKDSLPYFNSEVEVGEIVIKPTPNKKELKRIYDKLVDIRKQIIADETLFPKLAKANSDDLGSARVGGDLGWAKRGQFVTEFEAAAYNLSQGEISEPIKTKYGYHIIQLMGRRGNLINTRHILIKPDILEEDIQKAYNTLDSIRTLVEADSITFEYAVFKFSDEDEQSKNNAGILLNPQTGATVFEIGDLPPEIFFAVDTLKESQISAPVRFENIQTDEIQFKAILLVSRTAPHVANLKDDYHKIQNATLERKKLSYMENWVKEQKDKIFIKIDGEYSNCPQVSGFINP
jgi:peptidyl-prolyl cis-trans isomerase SurA